MSYSLRRSERAWREGRGARRGGYVTELKGRGKFEELSDDILDHYNYSDDHRAELSDGNDNGLHFNHVIKKGIGMMLPIEIDAFLYYDGYDNENHILLHWDMAIGSKPASSDSKRARSEFKKIVNAFVKEWENSIPKDPITDDLDDAFKKAGKKARLKVSMGDGGW